MKNIEIAWICDGKAKDCLKKTGCYYGKARGPCMHTTDKKHGKYKRDPKKEPGYFDKYSYGDTVRYYERETEKN